MQEVFCAMVIICCLLHIVYVIQIIMNNNKKNKDKSHDDELLLEGEKPSFTIKPKRPITSSVRVNTKGILKADMIENNEFVSEKPARQS